MILTDQNFEQEVERFSGAALVDFFASWCGPCQIMAPIIEELVKEYEGKDNVKIAKVNVDESPVVSQKYGIMSIPTIILFKNGKIVKQVMGVQSQESLKDLINSNL